MSVRDTAHPGAPLQTRKGAQPVRRTAAEDWERRRPQIATLENGGFYLRVGKRLIDVAVSSVLLLLLMPIFLVVALCIKCDSPGSVFYRGQRVGLGGRLFTFLKFRSMTEGACERKAELQHLNEADGPVFKVAADPRVTRMGRFLRRSSIDELPQLIHVLKGDMSLVGPRPPEPEEVLQYEGWQLSRLRVVPGITCLWQISGRSLIGFDEWMRLDLEYVENRSFRLDLKILLRTFPAVVSGRGAY